MGFHIPIIYTSHIELCITRILNYIYIA